MALTQNGSKTLTKSLFGYNSDASAINPAAFSVSGTVSGTGVTLGSAQTWAVNSQVIVTYSGTTYVGLANAAGSASTALTVDAWYNQSTWSVSTAPTGSLTITVTAPTLGAFFLGISSTSQTNYGQTTESTFAELTANGLGRGKATTISYTPGSAPTTSANSTGVLTLGYTWTYTGSTSVTANALGVFFAPYVASRANNTLMFATAISSAPTVTTNGDQLVVTETITQS